MLEPLRPNWLKFIIGWVVCLAIRLVPFRPPSLEPIMTTTMPFAKQYGGVAGFIFGSASMILYDAVQGKVGSWTWITAFAYGAVGWGAAVFLKSRPAKIRWFVSYAIIGTLVFDIATGLSVGPLFFGQPFIEAVVGQIPFTLIHLSTNVMLAATVSPLVYRWVVANPRLVVARVNSVNRV